VATPKVREPGQRAPAIEYVRAYLGRQLSEIERTDPLIRTGQDPDAVHDFRVALRRSRSVLRTTRELFDEEWLDELRTQLRWLGGELGALRDLDVLLETLREDVDPESTGVVRLLETERRRARKRALKALSSERYLSVLDRLGAAVEAPPTRASELSLERAAAREFAKLRRAGKRLERNPSDADIHRARIRAKRARYAAELVVPSVGAKPRRFIAEAKRFQDVVGGHQDAVTATERIHGVIARTKSLETAFAAGRLAERVSLRRTSARQKLPAAWKRLEDEGLKTWS
jgi:CHAD domain-containing protein